MKRALSLLLAASLSLSLVACGKTNDSGTSGSGSGSKAPTELSETQKIIQEAQGMTLEELLVLNPQIKNPNVIQPGQRLRVRG